jgi:hypothetical protein
MGLVECIHAVILSFEINLMDLCRIISSFFIVPDLSSVLPGTFPKTASLLDLLIL